MIATRTVRVGLLGFGTVGSGAYRMLHDNQHAITRKMGLPFEVVKIGVRDLDKPRSAPGELLTENLESIVDDPSIEVVLELIGGIDPAEALVERALRNGKHVVTANKELVAKSGARLVALAKSRGLDLHYEAAVGGGIPLVQPLKHQLAGNDVLRMMGILNGTSNYILTQMASEGADFGDALAEAQGKGYAEVHRRVPIDGIHREGIRHVTRADMAYAAKLGYAIKLLGIVDALPGDRILARVHPALVPKSHPISAVNGVYNALFLTGDFVGDLMFSGRGAGSDPTASAVVGDLVDVGRTIIGGGAGSAIPFSDEPVDMAPIDDLRSEFYLRIRVADRPRILGMIATVFGNFDVSLAAMEMKTLDQGFGEIVFLTHRCLERDFQAALAALRASGAVENIGNYFRVAA